MRFKRVNIEKHSIWQLIVLLTLLMPVCVGASSAFAQDKLRPETDLCTDFLDSENWQYEIDNLDKLLKADNYKEAEEIIRTLEGICARSPILKYTQGKLAEAQGDNEKAHAFYVEASDGLTNFELNPLKSKEIWYARFRMENQVASDYEKVNKQILWSGVGIGVGGIVLAATGFALAYHSHPVEFTELNQAYSVKTQYTAGWYLAGTGIAMFISGVIMSGVAGYRLTRIKNSAFAFEISPTGGSFRMVF